MAVDLSEYVPSLLREVRPPGSTLYGNVVASDWVGYLSDAFWEARLDGFLVDFTVNADDGSVEPVTAGGQDITQRDMALVVLYAGIKVLRNQILNTRTSFRAKSGTSEFETGNSATMLVEILKELKATKDRILTLSDEYSGTHVSVIDAFSTRLYSLEAGGSYYGSYSGSRELMG